MALQKNNKTKTSTKSNQLAKNHGVIVETVNDVELDKSASENKTDINKKNLLIALEKSLGVVTTACKSTNLSRSQHYKWMEEDEDYRNAVKELNEVAIDFAESKLHKLIEEKDTAATIFYLKTKGKHRGYVERVENMIGDIEQPLFGPDSENEETE